MTFSLQSVMESAHSGDRVVDRMMMIKLTLGKEMARTVLSLMCSMTIFYGVKTTAA